MLWKGSQHLIRHENLSMSIDSQFGMFRLQAIDAETKFVPKECSSVLRLGYRNVGPNLGRTVEHMQSTKEGASGGQLPRGIVLSECLLLDSPWFFGHVLPCQQKGFCKCHRIQNTKKRRSMVHLGWTSIRLWHSRTYQESMALGFANHSHLEHAE